MSSLPPGTIDQIVESSAFSGAADGSNPGARFRALAQEFSVLVVIATFTATLITAFLSLARDVINPSPATSSNHFFEIGMLLALFATGLQLGTILVAGRGAALSFREAAEHSGHTEHPNPHPPPGVLRLPGLHLIPPNDENTIPGSPPQSNLSALQKPQPTPPEDKNTVEEFRHYFFICEQLQLFGTALFFTSILFFIFFMFEHHRYPITFYAVSFVGAYIVLRTGFWKISALRQDIHLLKGIRPDWFKRMRGLRPDWYKRMRGLCPDWYKRMRGSPTDPESNTSFPVEVIVMD